MRLGTSLPAMTAMWLALAACGDDDEKVTPVRTASGAGGEGGAGGDDGPPEDPEEGRANGEPCTADEDCRGGLCLTEGDLGWAGGYCTALCGEPIAPCEDGSICVATGNDFSLCFRSCEEAADCPGAAQRCRVVDELRARAACVGGCDSDDQCQGACNSETQRCSLEEACDNDEDDDGDILQDCEELDCSTQEACVHGIATACAGAIDVSAGGTFTGNTRDGTNVFATICPARLGTYAVGVGSNEQVFQFVAPAKGALVLAPRSASGGDYDWYVRTSCDDASTLLGCSVAFGPDELAVELLAEAGDTYFLFIDNTAGEDPDYALEVAFAEQVCGDGVRVGTEECDDGNDADGDTCSSECEIDPEVACASAAPLTAAAVTGDTSEGTRGFTAACAGDGPELVYRYSPEADGSVTITVTPEGSADLVLHVRADCREEVSEIHCLDDGNSGDPESLTVNVTAGTPIDIFVDSYNNVSAGSFELNITPN
ncbi:DUF4215 domain-containing protein [Sorangium sp. So ce375]|uniref:DUF4215 domain-containing protein n=1 Tax=Sorangium sp. So ce375 TaxID=3133306 RepID=UPI003F5B5C90